MAMSTIKVSEESIQSAIVDYLRLSGWFVMVYARPRSHKELGGIILPGHPDLLAIRHLEKVATGEIVLKHLWVEVKAPGGKLSPDQKRLHAELREAGDWVEVWESVGQAIAALAPLGLGLEEWKP